MPTQEGLHLVALPPAVAPTASEQFVRTLVELTRIVWYPECTFESAIGSIAAAAAAALGVERVSVWHHDRETGKFTCLSNFLASDAAHEPTPEFEMPWTRADDYLAELRELRTYETIEIKDESASPEPLTAQADQPRRHRVSAMLCAPAFVEGELLGVICHESIDRIRRWTQEEIGFAGSMGDYVAMAYEIARRRRAEAEIEHLRLHDAGTGLGNRDYLVEVFRQRLDSPLPHGDTLTVVHVLVDASGGIAWSAGAPTHEEVMARIGARLRRLTSDEIDLARVRADGFAFVLPSSPQQRRAIRLAERALAAVRALDFDHDEVDPSAWVGITCAEADAENDARVLLRQAEEAAEKARSGDKFSYEVFDPDHHETLVQALRHERVLRDAFANGDFELHYQLEFDALAHQWVAAEALLRWRRDDRLITAGEFIAVVESSGLMLTVGRWVLRRACLDAVQWPAMPDGSYAVVRVNVSARQFDEAGLVEDVTAALDESGLAPSRLCLELTETTLMRDIDYALSVLQQLRAVGVQMAIDDFGTGYASLVYLKRLPIDVLKIDRSFVEGMPGKSVDAAIVRAVVGLAASLDIDVVAEGIESVGQQQALEALGVRRMQGWLYGEAKDQASTCRLLGIPFEGSS